jgi:hypothetical protein
MNDFGFVSFADFELQFKILILGPFKFEFKFKMSKNQYHSYLVSGLTLAQRLHPIGHNLAVKQLGLVPRIL